MPKKLPPLKAKKKKGGKDAAVSPAEASPLESPTGKKKRGKRGGKDQFPQSDLPPHMEEDPVAAGGKLPHLHDLTRTRRERLERGGTAGSMSPLTRLARETVPARQRDVSQVELFLEVEYDMLIQALSRRSSDWLSILADDALKDLADVAEVISFAAGDTVFAQGETGQDVQELWVLLDGSVHGSLKPGLLEFVEPMSTGLQEESKESISSKSSRGSKKKSTKLKKMLTNKKQKGRGEGGKGEAGEKGEGEYSKQDLVNEEIQRKNDAIVPVPIFTTRMFGATFGDETLFSGEKRGYTMTAAANSKLCRIGLDSFLAHFSYSEEQAKEKLRRYQLDAVARSFKSVTGSLMQELFPDEFWSSLRESSALRRYHAGQQIVHAPSMEVSIDVATLQTEASVEDDETAIGLVPETMKQAQHSVEEEPIQVYNEGQPTVFVLVSGQIALEGYASPPEGEEGVRLPKSREVHSIVQNEGAIFGEMAVLMGDAIEVLVGAVALTECQVCELPRDLLAEIVSELLKRKGFVHSLKMEVQKGEFRDEMVQSGMYARRALMDTMRQNARKDLLMELRAQALVEEEQEQEEDANHEGERERDAASEKGKLMHQTRRLQEPEACELEPSPTTVAERTLVEAEELLFNAEGLMMQAQQCHDWAMFHQEVVNAIELAAARYSEVLSRHVKTFPIQGFDRLSLEKKQQRLDLMLLQVSTYIPRGPMHSERMARCKATQQILCTQKDFSRLMHMRHNRVDFNSSTAVCNFMDKCHEYVKDLENQVPRYRVALQRRFGEEVGTKVFDEFHKWYQRKASAWQRCYELKEQQALLAQNIADLERQSRVRTFYDYEAHKLREMRARNEETMHCIERIRLDLLPLNRAVVQSCLIGLPSPPASAVAASPILACVLHLQRIIETAEDLRFAKGIATRQADSILHQSFKECLIGGYTEPPRQFSIHEPIKRRPDGSREVAPYLHGFMSNLGGWMFTDDAERWARQARRDLKLGGGP